MKLNMGFGENIKVMDNLLSNDPTLKIALGACAAAFISATAWCPLSF